MKKILLMITAIVAITVIYISCDNRKLITPSPAYVKPEAKTFEFIVDKPTDTIRLYTAQKYGEYTFKFKAFGSDGTELNKLLSKFSIIPLLKTGAHKVDNYSVSRDTTLTEGVTFNMKYYPANVQGTHKFILTFDNEYGQIFRDTITYEVLTFLSVPFDVTRTPAVINQVRPTDAFTFDVFLSSQDLTNQKKYYIHFDLPFPSSSTSIVIKKSNVTVTADQELIRGTTTFQAKLTNHPIGEAYNVRIKVYDENGEEKNVTVTYNVRANQIPVITNVTNNWTTTFRTIDGMVMGSYTQAITPYDGLNMCFNYAYLDNLYNIVSNLNVSINEDLGIVKVKLRGSSTARPFNVTYDVSVTNSWSTSIPNGKVTFRYPNETPGNRCHNEYKTWTNFYQRLAIDSDRRVKGISNTGTNSVVATNAMDKFNFGDIIYISVQDTEGVWSTEYPYLVTTAGLVGPAAWSNNGAPSNY